MQVESRRRLLNSKTKMFKMRAPRWAKVIKAGMYYYS